MTRDDVATGSAPAERGGWEFDADVAERFEGMLARSIPNYAGMRSAVTGAAVWLMEGKRPGRVMDLGCSRGAALRPVLDELPGTEAVGVEVSFPMRQAALEELAEFPNVELVDHDLREGLPACAPGNVILSVLTLQFVPIEHRSRLLGACRRWLKPGGGLILVEKVLGSSPGLDSMEVDLYYGTKRDAGYSQEAIDRKRLALEGVLVPLTAGFNEELLRSAGFDEVDVVWAWMNFRAWVARVPDWRSA